MAPLSYCRITVSLTTYTEVFDSLCIADLNAFPLISSDLTNSPQYTDYYPPHLDPHAFAINEEEHILYTCGAFICAWHAVMLRVTFHFR